MYRAALNAFLLIASYAVLASSDLVPSGIPLELFRSVIDGFTGTASVASSGSVGDDLPASIVYETLLERSRTRVRTGHLLMLVTLESFGRFNSTVDESVRVNLEHELSSLSSDSFFLASLGGEYQLGATLGAELRALCGFKEAENLNAFRINPSVKGLPGSCAPVLLRSAGYKTYYFHDGAPSFYRRNEIMPVIGFDRSEFQSPQIRNIWNCFVKPFCGSDANSYSRALKLVRSYYGRSGREGDCCNKLFISLLTIDTHAPYPSPGGAVKGYLGATQKSSRELSGFLRQVRASVPDSVGITVLLQSDHPPPLQINEESTGEVGSDKDNIVYLLEF